MMKKKTLLSLLGVCVLVSWISPVKAADAVTDVIQGIAVLAGLLILGAIVAGVLWARRPASFETLGRVFTQPADYQR